MTSLTRLNSQINASTLPISWKIQAYPNPKLNNKFLIEVAHVSR
jgi:hypothetical protein